MKVTLRFLHLLLTLLLATTQLSFGEGSKQLTPGQSNSALTDPTNDKVGYLAHDANFHSASGTAISSLSFLKPAGFSRNGATYSKDHRLNVRVRNGGYLYFGVHRAIHDQGTGSQNNLVITVRRTNAATGVDDPNFAVSTTLLRNTASPRSMLLVEDQTGVIDSYAEAQAGPNRPAIGGKPAVTNGYNPIFINSTGGDYDYYFEFVQENENLLDDATRFSVYDMWDITVVNSSDGLELPGRLRSKLWSFSAGGTANVFSSTFNMYPLVPSTDQAGRYFVKQVELAGLAPRNVFRFVTNSQGTNIGTTKEEKRKSQASQADYAEYEIFINKPDIAIWQGPSIPTFSVAISYTCNTTNGAGKSTFTINSGHSSTFIALINLNGQPGYQPNTADVLIEQSGPAGTRTLEWNGLNGLGQPVARNTSISYVFRNGSAPIHFPVWNGAANDGFRVEDVRPAPSPVVAFNSPVFWDDRNLSTTTFPDPQFELLGAVATNTSGVHSWGSTTTTAANYNAGEAKTINTWTYGYTSTINRTATYSYDCSADVGVTNTVITGPYTIGNPVTYTITATNNGPLLATNVNVTDKLDPTKFSDITSPDATYTISSGIWAVGSLAVGTSRTLTITAKPLGIGTIRTTASQTHTEPDYNTPNNSAFVDINVVASADIEVKNTVPQAVYNNGDVFNYTITAKNLGPNNATGVIITKKLPKGLRLQNLPAAYDTASGTWSVGVLALNETKTLTLQAKAVVAGTYTTTSTLGSRSNNEIDNNSSNNVSSNTITVNPDVILPVTLINFTATSQRDGIKVSWSTASEKNNAYFVVERSQDSRIFQVVVEVKGNGTTDQLNHYTLIDKQAPSGVIYYRLKQVDVDGKYTYSRIIAGERNFQSTLMVRVYPNPASRTIHLDLTALPEQGYAITFVNVIGSTIKQTSVKGGNLIPVDISNLSTGKYIIYIKGEDYLENIKFLKN